VLELKAVFAAGAAALVIAISNTVDSALEGVVLIATAAVSLGVLWRATAKVYRGLVRWSKGIDHMLDLPTSLHRIHRKLDDHTERLDRLERKTEPDVKVEHHLKRVQP
jgi:hypothetical protein